jgi:hypothetical protein
MKKKRKQDLIDARVIAEADDDSAWEAPIDVKRHANPSRARKAAFLARLRHAASQSS